MKNEQAEAVIMYNTSVRVSAGWRSITVTARVKLNKSGKMGEVVEVLDVDGNGTSGYTSRTGANRQMYSIRSIVNREFGLNKRVGSCELIEGIKDIPYPNGCDLCNVATGCDGSC